MKESRQGKGLKNLIDFVCGALKETSFTLLHLSPETLEDNNSLI